MITFRPKLLFFLYCLILCLAFLSSAPTDPEARAGLSDAGYNLFRRYVSGTISTWDVLLLGLLGLLLLTNSDSRRPVNLLTRVLKNKFINLYFFIFSLAILVGLFVILLGQMHVFVPRDWFRSVLPVAYMLLTYFLVVNIVRSKENLQTTWQLFELIAIAMVFYGFYRLYAILSGSILTLTPSGIPIVLYSEMLYFNLPILVYCISAWCGKRLGVFRWIVFFFMIGFILASTRRFSYIMLLVNIVIAFSIAHRSGLFTIRTAFNRSKHILASLCIGIIVALVMLPSLLEAIWFSIQSINMLSEVGFEYTGEFRIVQIENIFLNFWERPMTLLFGFGLGSKWHVIKELPITIDEVGSYMAYDAKVVAGGTDWLPFFHVTFFGTLFRFGLLGMLSLIYIVRYLYIDLTNYIRTVSNRDHQIILAALVCLVLTPVVMLGDNSTPVEYIVMGLNLGLIQGYRTAFLSETMRGCRHIRPSRSL